MSAGPPPVLIDSQTLQRRVAALGVEVRAACADLDELTLVVVLRSAFVFAADLARHIDLPTRVEFITLASYADDTGRQDVRLVADFETALAGRHLLVVDDIIDSGHTLVYLDRILAAHRPASVRRCVLLDKSARREVDVTVDHTGFTIDDVWVAGYGMDHGGLWRTLPYIGSVNRDTGG